MNDRDIWTVDAMERFGGSFVKALSNLCRHADGPNLLLIKKAWPEYWEKYEVTGRELEQKENGSAK